MRFIRYERMGRNITPLALLALVVSGCSSSAELRFEDAEGVPLAELDTTGPAPEEIALLGPDRVLVTQGNAFTVTVDGDAAQAADLRFVLEDGTLGIGRTREGEMRSRAATVRVTLPAPPRQLSVAGSGEMVSDRLAGSAEVHIAGSGSLSTLRVDSDALAVSIAGSGSYRGAGQAGTLDLSLAGSGDADLAGLTVERADLSIAGSGDTVLASDGEVSAAITGSGNVTVRGTARCTLNRVGSGTLTCERGEQPA